MPESDPLRILLSHDHWATTQLIEVCTHLPADAFHRRFEMGHGSLHDTLTHMVSAMRTWTDTLVGREARPRPDDDGQRRTPDQIRALLEESSEELFSEARRLPLEEMASRRLRNGTIAHLTRGAIFTHVATHGMHHRAQCLNMLRQLGVKPMPLSSVAEWAMAGS